MQQSQIRLLEIRPVAGQEGFQQILSHPVHTDTGKGRDSPPEEDPSESQEYPDQEKGNPQPKDAHAIAGRHQPVKEFVDQP
jgi:hypothetical protein